TCGLACHAGPGSICRGNVTPPGVQLCGRFFQDPLRRPSLDCNPDDRAGHGITCYPAVSVSDRSRGTKMAKQIWKGTKLWERSASLADDPLRGRHPTRHERVEGLPGDSSYHDGPAPWDIDQPQPAIMRVASEGGFAGAVLDAGCGTGEHALHVASLGLSVLGVDVAETALAIARAKANDRGIEVEFAAADALQLERLGRRFATVLDCGLFHTFDGGERPRYVAGLASVTEHDGTLCVLCFRDDGPDTGPHPVSQEALRAAFNSGT